MTKDEAIEELMYLKHLERADSPPDKALDMAIEALENYDGVAEALNGSVELYRKLKEKYVNLADNLIKKIKQLEPLNNSDCPEWVLNVIRGMVNETLHDDHKR